MNKYLVALSVGGLMEDPVLRCEDFEIIEANNRSEATEIYNTKNNCSFYYGCCVAEKINGRTKVLIRSASYEEVDKLRKSKP